jgi:CheY-like chemotaxis protein
MTILVIEDEPTDLRLMRAVLQGSGHIVHVRTSAHADR